MDIGGTERLLAALPPPDQVSRVYVDIDDCLLDTVREVARCASRRLGRVVSPGEFRQHPEHASRGWLHFDGAADDWLVPLYQNVQRAANIPAVYGAPQGLIDVMFAYETHLLTARPPSLRSKTVDNLLAAGFVLCLGVGIIHAGSRAEKASFLRDDTVLLDDLPPPDARGHVYHFSRPWNHDKQKRISWRGDE